MVRKRAVPAPADGRKRAAPAPAPAERKNRVMLSFNDQDYESLALEAQEAKLPIATYARLLILRRKAAPALQ